MILTSTEFERIASPDGRFIAVVEYRSWLSFIPMAPGGGSDKPGFMTIYSRDGRFLGRTPLPMLQFAQDLLWEGDTAEIPLVAHWDLSEGLVAINSQ